MFDAMTASALKKTSRQACSLPQKSNCRTATCSKIRPILTRETNCLHDLPRAFEAAQRLSDLFRKRLQNDDVQDFDVRWDHSLLSASDMPSDVILDAWYKSKLQDSVQLQTVLALYDQETMRNTGQLFTIEDVCATSN